MRGTRDHAPLPLSSLILKITLADNHRVSLLHSLRPRPPPVMTMRLLMTGRMQKCHQSYVRALANCREASERARERRKRRKNGRKAERARYMRTDGRTDDGEQCRSCRNMIRAIPPSTASTGEGRHARIRSDEGFISKAGRRPILISRQKPTLSVSRQDLGITLRFLRVCSQIDNLLLRVK